MLNITFANINTAKAPKESEVPDLDYSKMYLYWFIVSYRIKDYPACELLPFYMTQTNQTFIWKSRRHVYITVAIWQRTIYILLSDKLNQW